MDKAARGELFYSVALRRINRTIVLLSFLATLGIFVRFRQQVAFGFAAGAVLAYWNFRWLERGVVLLADRIVEAQEGSHGRHIIAKFLVRYLLGAGFAVVLYRFLPGAIGAFLAGLFVPAGAILIEAVFEMYVALTQEI